MHAVAAQAPCELHGESDGARGKDERWLSVTKNERFFSLGFECTQGKKFNSALGRFTLTVIRI